jgi:hypothetical protein
MYLRRGRQAVVWAEWISVNFYDALLDQLRQSLIDVSSRQPSHGTNGCAAVPTTGITAPEHQEIEACALRQTVAEQALYYFVCSSKRGLISSVMSATTSQAPFWPWSP